ncbi:MAG: L-histidine N(alpha)-methyltransferase [Acidobacteriaceae bacterium]|nr:L-histidine N(alpha)-methyltransferase [Acidobacteriaceae bacterium]
MSTPVSASSRTETSFAQDVRYGLTRSGQKELAARYFYDDLGSALFEAITLLPEYGLTRADARILRNHAREMIDRLPGTITVAELGSGSGQKTRHVLRAVGQRQRLVRYCPIDVSRLALDRCARELLDVARVDVFLGPYISGLENVVRSRQPGERLLVLFLGSSIGNFGPDAALGFLREVRSTLEPADALLLGADLVKPVQQLLLAYDDPTGVTAAFNLNVLARANRELGSDFNLRRFGHEARYIPEQQRIEMHLRSTAAQEVRVPGAGFCVSFEEGETIWTESSHKYELAELDRMAQSSGFRVEGRWVDDEWPFVETLWIAR